MIRVLTIAESVVLRAGLEAIVQSSASLSVIASQGLTDWLEQAQTLAAEVVLLQAEPDLALLSAIEAAGDAAPAIVLLLEADRSTAIAALKAGLRGLLPLSATETEILTAIEAAAAGLVTLHPDFVECLSADMTPLAEPPIAASLTPRELEVLQMLAAGLGNKTIARQLQISEHTVKFHVSSLLSKLQASSRTEAVAIGIRLGWVWV